VPARSRLWPDPRVKPPYGAVEIDWAHPLATGLVACWLFNEGAGTVLNNLVSVAQQAFINDNINVTWSASRLGLALAGNSGAGNSGIGIDPGITTGTTFTWDTRVAPDLSSTYGALFVAADQQGLYIRSSGLFDVVTGSDQQSNTAITANTRHHYAQVCAAGSGTHNLDGVADGTFSSITSHVSTRMFQVSTLRYGGICEFQRFWSRALSASEVQWLAAEPYAMLRPIIQRRYFVPAAGSALNLATAWVE